MGAGYPRFRVTFNKRGSLHRPHENRHLSLYSSVSDFMVAWSPSVSVRLLLGASGQPDDCCFPADSVLLLRRPKDRTRLNPPLELEKIGQGRSRVTNKLGERCVLKLAVHHGPECEYSLQFGNVCAKVVHEGES